MSLKLTIESSGIEAVLNSGSVASLLAEAAMKTASAAEAAYPEPHSDGPVDVVVEPYTASGGKLKGSRPAYALVAKHPAALGYEAKRGVLVKAARSAGLEVKRK